MDRCEGLDERTALEEAHATARVEAGQRMVTALAQGSSYASQKLPRGGRVKPHKVELQRVEAQAAAKIKAVAAMKTAPKHKPRVIKFTGAVTVPIEAVRVEPPADAPRLGSGWAPVYYQDGPPPVGAVMSQLKTYRTFRRQRQAAGLGPTYKRGLQAELVPGGAELDADAAVTREDAEKLEAWLARARQHMQQQQEQQQQQQGQELQQGQLQQPHVAGSGAKGQAMAKPGGPATATQPSLALPRCNADERLAARARAIAAAPALKPVGAVRFQGDLHAPAAPTQPPVTSTGCKGSWEQLPAPTPTPQGPKIGTLESLPPAALRQGVPRSHLAAAYLGRPTLPIAGDAEQDGDRDVDMAG